MERFLLSTMISIPPKASEYIIYNYKIIDLSSILGCGVCVLDWIILWSNINAFETSGLQFGFKPKHSRAQCTYVVDEIVNYIMLLDASHAFDRVNYMKLFRPLINKGKCKYPYWPITCFHLPYYQNGETHAPFFKHVSRCKTGWSIFSDFM